MKSIGTIKQLAFKILAGLLTTAVVITAVVMGISNQREKPATRKEDHFLPDVGIEETIWNLTVEETVTLKEGSGHQLQCICVKKTSCESVEDKDVDLQWSSSNTDIVTVDSWGVVIARAPGDAVIQVSTEDGSALAICRVTVEKKPAPVLEAVGIQVTEVLALTIGGEDRGKLEWVMEPADVKPVTVTYSSNHTAVATVDEAGVVRAVGNGMCTIETVAVDAAGNSVSAKTAVTVHTSVKKLKLKGTTISVGESGTLMLQVTPAKADTGIKVTWESSNPQVATVNKNGKVKAIAAGSATITATNEFGITAKCTVKVKEVAVEEKPTEKPMASCTYCNSNNHQAAQCGKKAVDNGAVGRWSIPDVKVNVAVYMGTSSAQENTEIVDQKDSGIYMRYDTGYLIGDHNYQGFSAIKQCKPGTVAYLDTGDKMKKYICTRVLTGYNEKYYLTDESGAVYTLSPGNIANYTCNDKRGSITIVEFTPADGAPSGH